MNEHAAAKDARCGDRDGPPGIYPCIRDEWHDGPHGYAGTFWPNAEKDATGA